MAIDEPFTYYEFFAGGGMARAGLGKGWQCVFANDFDKKKAESYAANWGSEHLYFGDVWKINPGDLPGRADLAWASSPCQDLSLAGKRAGLGGGRSSAFWGFWELVETLNKEGRAPRTIVIENVTGLLTSHEGKDFNELCRALANEGYRFGGLEIDAAFFLPQSRPRLFVVATREMTPPSLEEVEASQPFHSGRIEKAYERLDADLRDRWIWWTLPQPAARNQSIWDVLEDDAVAKWHSEAETKALLDLLSSRHKELLKRASDRGARTVGTLFRRMRTVDGKKVQRAEIRFDGIAGCLRTPGGGSSRQFVVVVKGNSVRTRLLSAVEAARLMGLDEYILPKRVNAALHLFGDGVAVPIVSWLSENLLTPLCSQEIKDGEEARRRAGA